MKQYIKTIFPLLFFTFMISSCVKDLDVTPQDPSMILSGNLGDDPAYMDEALAKIYASFIISGQGDDNGGSDIDVDNNQDFYTTMRAFWNLQEITTDEAICAWGDVGIADLNTQTWSPSNPFLTALYQRLSLSITYANEFINQANLYDFEQKEQYIAEARFLRALAYYWLMDMFGNPPFTTEEDGVGKYQPEQIQRADLFQYVVSELKDIVNELGEPGFSYPQADKGACWMLLAKTYLNAEVYTRISASDGSTATSGTPMWDSCKMYCDSVIDCGAYDLADDYRHNFSADNGYDNGNSEMIFAWEQDGEYVQGYVGTTFIIESSSDATYIRAEEYHGLTENTNWNGNRTRINLMDILVDTLTNYPDGIPEDDTIFAAVTDQRVLLRQKRNLNIPAASSSGDYGIGVYKFTARNHDGTLPSTYSPAYACTDFPVFRLADAYLMRAEALHNLSEDGNAASDINTVRERAYGNNSGNITAAQVTDDFILDERAREFYYEGHRRTDLVRFGQFTNGSYTWQWKGNSYEGATVSPYMDLFPIPGDEIAANPNIKQNNGY